MTEIKDREFVFLPLYACKFLPSPSTKIPPKQTARSTNKQHFVNHSISSTIVLGILLGRNTDKSGSGLYTGMRCVGGRCLKYTCAVRLRGGLELTPSTGGMGAPNSKGGRWNVYGNDKFMSPWFGIGICRDGGRFWREFSQKLFSFVDGRIWQ